MLARLDYKSIAYLTPAAAAQNDLLNTAIGWLRPDQQTQTLKELIGI